MNKFVVINHSDKINLPQKWVDSKEFKADQVVDQYGNPPGKNYNGRLYKVVASKERSFSPIERIGRGLLGVIAIILSLGIAYFQSDAVKNLFSKKERIDFGALIVQKKETPKPIEIAREKIIPPVDVDVPKDQFPILIKTLTNKVFEISVNPSENILAVKKKIQAETGEEFDRFNLIFAGKQLEDTRKISDYGIKEGFTIHFLLKLRGD